MKRILVLTLLLLFLPYTLASAANRIIVSSNPVDSIANNNDSIDVIVDRLVLKTSIRRRLEESVAVAVKAGDGKMLVYFPDTDNDILFSEFAACNTCGISVPELSTQLFSFNNRNT